MESSMDAASGVVVALASNAVGVAITALASRVVGIGAP
jgi:hypothetical protein